MGTADSAGVPRVGETDTELVISFRDGITYALLRRPAVQMAIFAFVLSAAAFFINAFNFPYFEADEGTYLSQAWAFSQSGQLSPYYYMYDHVPGAWIMISVWSSMLGGLSTFGTSVDTGRFIMGLLQIASGILVAVIVFRLSRSRIAAAAAVIFFALSPLGIYFHRRVLLDNVMVFWLLLAILGLIFCLEQRRFILAAITGLMLGMALISKEPAIVFFPATALGLVFGVHSWRRGLGLAATAMVSSLAPVVPYVVYAWGRNEFFPGAGVSLIGSFFWQTGRGAGSAGPSALPADIVGWLFRDSLTLYAGLAAVVITPLLIVFSKSDRRGLLMSLFAVSYIVFLLAWHNVLELYIVPLLPFLAICIGLGFPAAARILQRGFKTRGQYVNIALGAILLVPAWFLIDGARVAFTADQTLPQRQATEWIRNNVPMTGFVVIDNYDWVDLHDPAFGKTVPGAHYYWKVVTDPTIRQDWLGNDWQRIDYLAVTPQMLNDIKSQNMTLLKNAYDHSTVEASFQGAGWQVEIRRVHKLSQAARGVWGFEDGQNSAWQIEQSADVAPAKSLEVKQDKVHSGQYALELNALLNNGAKNSIAEKSERLGDQVSAWVYLPPSAPAGIWVLPYLLDSRWQWQNGGGVVLKPGEWVKVSWKPDANKTIWPVQKAGFMFGANNGYVGPIYIDDISLNGSQ
jgi:4-amino-4-deoxy-L-arabinose transferase-like glycosyltransferase